MSACARDPVTAYVALGGNLGDAAAMLRQAMGDLDRCIPGTRVTRRSALYRTAPVDSSGPDYLNAVVELDTQLSAPDLLQALRGLESAAGRERPFRNAPRTLDLDLLLYGSARIDSAELSVPHPRMDTRAFVLVPLAEIAPDCVMPAQLAAVSDQGCVNWGQIPIPEAGARPSLLHLGNHLDLHTRPQRNLGRAKRAACM